MTDRTIEILPADPERLATRVLQAILASVLVYGVVTFDGGAIVNAGLGLGVTFLPALLRRDLSVPMDPTLTFGITFAVVFHAVGTLGPYTTWGWYDQVAHFISATVVAAVGYATARAFVLHEENAEVPQPYMFVFILLFVMAFGVLWEIAEFTIEGLATTLGMATPLAQFGVEDIVFDLVANVVGGLAVAIWGTTHRSGFVRSLARRFTAKKR